jgi:CheY-like chemotaxis protein
LTMQFPPCNPCLNDEPNDAALIQSTPDFTNNFIWGEHPMARARLSSLSFHCFMNNYKIMTAEKSAGAPIPDRKKLTHRILVVDDDDDTRQLSVALLAGCGYGVEAVKDGAAGWQAIRSKSYDLVITDNRMPKMTGVEMIEKVRSACMTIPVIMATTFLPMHEFARKPWLKPDAMLQRPYSKWELLETVKNILRLDDSSGSRKSALPAPELSLKV